MSYSWLAVPFAVQLLLTLLRVHVQSQTACWCLQPQQLLAGSAVFCQEAHRN